MSERIVSSHAEVGSRFCLRQPHRQVTARAKNVNQAKTDGLRSAVLVTTQQPELVSRDAEQQSAGRRSPRRKCRARTEHYRKMLAPRTGELDSSIVDGTAPARFGIIICSEMLKVIALAS